MSYSVVIPSKLSTNLFPCVDAVLRCQPRSRIIVIDDGLAARHPAPSYIEGIKPFVFARNVNLGIRAAMQLGDDAVLLNDDALLMTDGGFDLLAAQAGKHGLVSAATNVTGYPVQFRRPGTWPPRAADTVAFVCVYLPASTVRRVGMLDERFACYGGDDVDYCRRVRRAGLSIAVVDGCFVDHSRLRSTFRGDPQAPGDIATATRILAEKYSNA
jgi:glycosyltransferase involved in cell wall biosynthesis